MTEAACRSSSTTTASTTRTKLDVANSRRMPPPPRAQKPMAPTALLTRTGLTVRQSRPPTRTGLRRRCRAGAGIAAWPKALAIATPPQVRTPSRTITRNDISSTSGASTSASTSKTDTIVDGLPVRVSSVSSDDCPCDACDGDDWASGDLDSDCEDAVVDYCTSYFNGTRILVWSSTTTRPVAMARSRATGTISSSTARQTVEAAWARSIFSAGNERPRR